MSPYNQIQPDGAPSYWLTYWPPYSSVQGYELEKKLEYEHLLMSEALKYQELAELVTGTTQALEYLSEAIRLSGMARVALWESHEIIMDFIKQ